MLARGGPQALRLSTGFPLEVDGSPLDRSSRTALLALKTDQCWTDNLLSPLYKCRAECLQLAVPPRWAKVGDHSAATKWGVPGHDLGGQQAAKVLPTSLIPTAPQPKTPSGSCRQGEHMLWHVLGWFFVECWVEGAHQSRPCRCQHTADCTSSCS